MKYSPNQVILEEFVWHSDEVLGLARLETYANATNRLHITSLHMQPITPLIYSFYPAYSLTLIILVSIRDISEEENNNYYVPLTEKSLTHLYRNYL